MRMSRRTFSRAILGFALWAGLGFASPLAEAQLYGIDVSSYQGAVDWGAVSNAGYSFGFAKATEGTGYTDATFASNWGNMKAAGIIPGAYHYGHPGSDAVTQAQHFVNAVRAAPGGLSGGLQLALDLETTDGLSPSRVLAWTKTFLNEVQYLTGKPAILYTGFYFWRDSAGNSPSNFNCPLWIASYSASPTIPSAWSIYTFWQYSDTGSVPGVSGNVDLDTFNGSYSTLLKFTFP